MYKKALFSILVVGLCCVVTGGIAWSQAAAPEKQVTKEAGLSAWLKNLQKKIEQIIPKKSLTVTTGVAGVRGSKEEAKSKLYWKGKKGEEPVTEEELAKFKAALDSAAKNDKQASVKELEDFMKTYPDSALVPDVKKTLDLVRAEGK